MAEHAWCRDIPRDEAVRAAEDGREGPLPTLEECIERQKHAAMTAGVKEGFVKADGEWKRLTDDELRQLLVIPKSVSATSAPEQENKGDSMADRAEISRAGQSTPSKPSRGPKCTERESVAERRPVDAGGGGNVTGLRTERITLEISHDLDAPLGDWIVQVIDESLGYDEYVRVVEEAESTDLRHRWDRDGERCLKCRDKDWMGGPCGTTDDEYIAALTAERDAAIREREAAKARVAELEAASNSSAILTSSQAASGGGEEEPVAWRVEYRGFIELYSVEQFATERASEVRGTVVPLYRSPPQPRGWLTGEERRFVHWWAHEDRAPTDEELDAFKIAAKALLARSTPPEVALPALNLAASPTYVDVSQHRDAEWHAALADAGVTVKEVGE